MPIHRRLPKRGFANIFALQLNEVSLGRVQTAIDKGKLDASKPVTVEALVAAGVLNRAMDGVRILGGGELKAKVAFEVHGASGPAAAAIEKLGGSLKKLAAPKRNRTPDDKKNGKQATNKGGEAKN
jgi:large subunit ribosomal protein L15